MAYYFRRFMGRRRICCSSLIVFLIFTVLAAIYSLLSNHVPDDDESNVMVVLSESKFQKEYIDKKGIHVIVGQYNGKSLPWLGSANLTEDILNSNNYNPVPKAGENGSPVYIAQYEQQKMKILYHINKFNLVASDKISVKRSLPDPRKQSCRDKIYSRNIGKSSIIIVFHNEAWSTLLRTVHSVINTSPRSILKEIIMVDDASSRTFLGPDLDRYMTNLSKSSHIPIKIVRSRERIGLIKARLIGAKIARGKVLTFLDAHVEATIGWLEPLLDRIAEDPSRVVCPVIDIIHEETFAFARSFELHWGGINWNLHFRWYPLGQKELQRMQQSKANNHQDSMPFKTPIMAGGLFAMDRDYFYRIGAYDSYMDIWGGENIELSLRVWQCGGSMEIEPCSHVAHLFRKSSPYTFPRKEGVTGVLYTNLARVVHVWMDPEYRNFVYKINPVMRKTIYGDQSDLSVIPSKLVNLTERIDLKKRLGCRSFSWFLENVWPEHFFPTHDRFFGKIRNVKLGECLQRPNADGSGPSNNGVGRADLDRCAIETYSPQCFVYTKQGVIMTDESICLDAINLDTDPSVLLLACSGSSRQKWKYSPTDKSLRHAQSDLCLDIEANNRRKLTLGECSRWSKSQQWDMIAINWFEP